MTAIEKRRLGEGVLGKSDFRYRYADSTCHFDTPFGSNRPIKYGDRLLARIIMGGRTVVEFFISEVSDFSELLGEIRKKVKGLRGLARMYVRNYSRGWSLEKPFMLYSGASSGTSFRTGSSSEPSRPSVTERRMLFPWETH